MARSAAALGGLMLIVTVWSGRLMAEPARGFSAAPSPPAASTKDRAVELPFALPAQPLQDALDRYGELTGSYGFYSAGAVAGRWSAPLFGRYTPDAALRLLIENTGLVVHYTAADAFVLEPAPAAGERSLDYDGLLQAQVRERFCAEPLIAAGDYRLAFSFHVDAAGAVERPVLLDSTGDAGRDEAILRVLRGLKLERGPLDTSQPFVMLILPQSVAPWKCEAR